MKLEKKTKVNQGGKGSLTVLCHKCRNDDVHGLHHSIKAYIIKIDVKFHNMLQLLRHINMTVSDNVESKWFLFGERDRDVFISSMVERKITPCTRIPCAKSNNIF